MEKYDVTRSIGKGSYGEVFLVKHKKDRKQYVLKRIKLEKASKKEAIQAEQEAKLLSKLRHPNIVSYRESFDSEGFLYIAMGYCEGGDLYSKLKEQNGKSLEEHRIVEWFVQIAMALQYMHERNILHRDLKTQNIFLTKSNIVKVGDLGIARILDSSSDMANTLIGTPYYMSPEIFGSKPYNHKSDVWALGCCVYEMCTLKHAFNGKDMNSLVYNILRGKTPVMPKRYSEELLHLIKAMLLQSPDKRPSVNRILRDPYIKRNISIFLEGAKRKRPGRPITEPKKPDPPPYEPQLEPLGVANDLEVIREDDAEADLNATPVAQRRRAPSPHRKRDVITPKRVTSSPARRKVAEAGPSPNKHDPPNNQNFSNRSKERNRSKLESAPKPKREPSPRQRHPSPKATEPQGRKSSPRRRKTSPDESANRHSSHHHDVIKRRSRDAASPQDNDRSSSSDHTHSASGDDDVTHRRKQSDDVTRRAQAGRRRWSDEPQNQVVVHAQNGENSEISSHPAKSDVRLKPASSSSHARAKVPLPARPGSGEPNRHVAGKAFRENSESGYSSQGLDGETPRHSINLSARARRRERLELETPRTAVSVDMQRGSARGADRQPASRSVDSAGPHRPRSGGGEGRHLPRMTPREARGRSRDEAALAAAPTVLPKLHRRQPSLKDSSSEEDEEEANEAKQADKRERRSEKEMNNLISVLGSTLQLNKEAEEEGDSPDATVEVIPEVMEDEDEDDGDTLVPIDPKQLVQPKPAVVGETYSVSKPRVRNVPEVVAPEHSAPQKGTLSATGHLLNRINILRKDVVRALGVEKVKRAYDILDQFEGYEVEPNLVDLLGKEDFEEYAGKIWQLKFCEEAAFGLG